MSDRTEDAQRLGLEIRELRKARGLTLKDLSAQIACSTAYLSRIELGSARVSVELLQEIGRVLSVDPGWFFPKQSGERPIERRYIVRRGERRFLSDMYTRSTEELGFQDELLSSTLSGSCYLLMSRFPAKAGARPRAAEDYVFEGEQHGIVTKGEVLLILGSEEIVLKEGDSFSYPSTLPHRFFNNIDAESTIVWAMSPVRITW